VAVVAARVNVSEQAIQALLDRVAALESQVSSMQSGNQLLAALLPLVQVIPGEIYGVAGPHIVFQGANVHVRNGLGSTGAIDGRGNLFVGWDDWNSSGRRGGSHNLVVGPRHDFMSSGGIVAGLNNTITAPNAVIFGYMNRGNGELSAILGGQGNETRATTSTIIGGFTNVASGTSSTVGGAGNEASGSGASVTGGSANVASGQASSISGGVWHQAIAPNASISGGYGNVVTAEGGSVAGGRGNTADGDYSSIAGGYGKNTTSTYQAVPPAP
jgi:hypothetical protein